MSVNFNREAIAMITPEKLNEFVGIKRNKLENIDQDSIFQENDQNFDNQLDLDLIHSRTSPPPELKAFDSHKRKQNSIKPHERSKKDKYQYFRCHQCCNIESTLDMLKCVNQNCNFYYCYLCIRTYFTSYDSMKQAIKNTDFTSKWVCYSCNFTCFCQNCLNKDKNKKEEKIFINKINSEQLEAKNNSTVFNNNEIINNYLIQNTPLEKGESSFQKKESNIVLEYEKLRNESLEREKIEREKIKDSDKTKNHLIIKFGGKSISTPIQNPNSNQAQTPIEQAQIQNTNPLLNSNPSFPSFRNITPSTKSGEIQISSSKPQIANPSFQVTSINNLTPNYSQQDNSIKKQELVTNNTNFKVEKCIDSKIISKESKIQKIQNIVKQVEIKKFSEKISSVFCRICRNQDFRVTDVLKLKNLEEFLYYVGFTLEKQKGNLGDKSLEVNKELFANYFNKNVNSPFINETKAESYFCRNCFVDKLYIEEGLKHLCWILELPPLNNNEQENEKQEYLSSLNHKPQINLSNPIKEPSIIQNINTQNFANNLMNNLSTTSTSNQTKVKSPRPTSNPINNFTVSNTNSVNKISSLPNNNLNTIPNLNAISNNNNNFTFTSNNSLSLGKIQDNNNLNVQKINKSSNNLKIVEQGGNSSLVNSRLNSPQPKDFSLPVIAKQDTNEIIQGTLKIPQFNAPKSTPLQTTFSLNNQSNEIENSKELLNKTINNYIENMNNSNMINSLEIFNKKKEFDNYHNDFKENPLAQRHLQMESYIQNNFNNPQMKLQQQKPDIYQEQTMNLNQTFKNFITELKKQKGELYQEFDGYFDQISQHQLMNNIIISNLLKPAMDENNLSPHEKQLNEQLKLVKNINMICINLSSAVCNKLETFRCKENNKIDIIEATLNEQMKQRENQAIQNTNIKDSENNYVNSGNIGLLSQSLNRNINNENIANQKQIPNSIIRSEYERIKQIFDNYVITQNQSKNLIVTNFNSFVKQSKENMMTEGVSQNQIPAINNFQNKMMDQYLRNSDNHNLLMQNRVFLSSNESNKETQQNFHTKNNSQFGIDPQKNNSSMINEMNSNLLDKQLFGNFNKNFGQVNNQNFNRDSGSYKDEKRDFK